MLTINADIPLPAPPPLQLTVAGAADGCRGKRVRRGLGDAPVDQQPDRYVRRQEAEERKKVFFFFFYESLLSGDHLVPSLTSETI